MHMCALDQRLVQTIALSQADAIVDPIAVAEGAQGAAFDTQSHALVEVPRVAARHALGAVPAAVVRDGVRVVGAAAALVGLHGCPRRVVAIAAEAVIARGKALRGRQLEDAHTVVLRPRVDARLGHVAGGAGLMTGPTVEARAALALGAACPERIASRAAGARVAAVYVATAICFFPAPPAISAEPDTLEPSRALGVALSLVEVGPVAAHDALVVDSVTSMAAVPQGHARQRFASPPTPPEQARSDGIVVLRAGCKAFAVVEVVLFAALLAVVGAVGRA